MPTSKPSQLDSETKLLASEAAAAIEQHLAEAEQVEPDPLAYAQRLGITLWEGQERLLAAVRDNRRVVCVAGNAVGKTFASAVLVAWWMQHPDAVALTTASTWTQVKQQLWREINSLQRPCAAPCCR